VFLFADQLRASSLPLFGEHQIKTPNIDRLATEGVTCTNAISPCPLCTPYRGALLTGRHPQTTGHVINFVTTRHDEIGIGDAFKRAGYRTGWVGKWHLHCGSWPAADMETGEGPFYIPPGRDRFGFDHWRGYNFHWQYFNGWVNEDNWSNKRWGNDYETDALFEYSREFIAQESDDPFCLFISPHQPHDTLPGMDFAPEAFYKDVPEHPELPDNIPAERREEIQKEYRHYLAMILAVDKMVGEVYAALEKKGVLDETLFVFSSDHGSNFGAHDSKTWSKQQPYEESLHIPLIMRLPGVFEPGSTSDALIGPQDIFPTLCSMGGISIPKTVEGFDLSGTLKGDTLAFEQDALLTENFTEHLCFPGDPDAPAPLDSDRIWRGVRTKQYNYARWLNGRIQLHDLSTDPLQKNNLAGKEEYQTVQEEMEEQLQLLLEKRGDALAPGDMFHDWFDDQRRVVKNAFGKLPHPNTQPDWSLL